MQVLQRFFKVIQQKQSVNTANRKEIAYHAGEEEKITSTNQTGRRRSRKGEQIDLDCKDLNRHLAALLRRENLRACFSSSLYVYSVKIKKEDIVRGLARTKSGHNKPGYADQSASSHHVGNKVLPVSDTSPTSSTRRLKQTEKRGKSKGVSKMKELMRWSAATKSQKGVKHTGMKFQVSHFSVKGLPSGDREPITESPKISFQLSTISGSPAPCSLYSDRLDQCHWCTKEGNWITTDDEFVVLEL